MCVCAAQEACTAHATAESGKFHRNDSSLEEGDRIKGAARLRYHDVFEALFIRAPDIADGFLREQLRWMMKG
jgi:hypothetical protein